MKPKVLYINSVCGFGSTGRLASDLSKMEDFESLVCYGRKKDLAGVNSYRFANFFDNAFGALGTIIFDNNLDICKIATKRLIKKIKEFKPDIINIQNIHGYYLNIKMLYEFLKEYDKPVVWALHDCFSMTGYCPHFDYIGCDKYKTECKDCPYGFAYPFSLFKQRVNKEFKLKKQLFNSLEKLTIISTSDWTSSILSQSYLKNNKIVKINNGLQLSNYKPTKKKNSKFTVMACSSVWTKEKGIDELNKIIPLLDKDIEVIIVGQGSDKINGCKAIARTNNRNELIDLYSSSHLFINPTLQETFGMVNVEALACGTPVITYKTGGSPETVDDKTGIIIEKKDYQAMANAINKLKENYYFKSEDCINRSKVFAIENMYKGYKELYESLLAN